MSYIQVHTGEKYSSSTHSDKSEDANILEVGLDTILLGHLLFLLLNVEVALSDKGCPLELPLADLLNVNSIGTL